MIGHFVQPLRRVTRSTASSLLNNQLLVLSSSSGMLRSKHIGQNASICNPGRSIKAVPLPLATSFSHQCCYSSTTSSSSSITGSDTAASEPSPLAPAAVSEDKSVLPDKLYKQIELELLAYAPAVLDSYEWFILTAASHLGIEVGEVYSPRKSDKFRFQLLRSAHVHKKHKVHYEVRAYHRFITLKKLTGSTASTYLEYIQRNLPEGVGMKVSKLEVLPKPDYMLSVESSSST